MASRFVVADNDVIEELKTSSENSYTGKSTNLWVGVFKKWPALRNIGEDMETYEVQELDKFTINLQINFALYFLVKLWFNCTCVFKVSENKREIKP
jgi:hypothetical protein